MRWEGSGEPVSGRPARTIKKTAPGYSPGAVRNIFKTVWYKIYKQRALLFDLCIKGIHLFLKCRPLFTIGIDLPV